MERKRKASACGAENVWQKNKKMALLPDAMKRAQIMHLFKQSEDDDEDGRTGRSIKEE